MPFISTSYQHQPTLAPVGMMDMRTLHLMFTLVTVSWAQDLVVSQPSSAEGTEGSSVTLQCSYSSTTKPRVGSFWWMKDQRLEVRNATREFAGRVTLTQDQGFLLERRADIEIRDLRHYDSGMYRCVVNIPGVRETSGNGTELRVVKPIAVPKAAQQEDYMVLVWLLLRGILCTFGITTVALVTRLYYEKSSPKEAQNRSSN